MTDLSVRGYKSPEEPKEIEVDFNEGVETPEVIEDIDLGQEEQENQTVETVEENKPVPPVEETKSELDDELIFKHLSERLGREIKSIDDLSTKEKEVVEINPFEEDTYLKNFAEWRKKTGRTAEDWVKYQRNFDEVSDIDIARELLQLEYPTLKADEIELELSERFIPSELDSDREEAVKNLNLKKFVSSGRTKLEEMKQDLGNPLFQELSPEVKEDLKLAKEVKESLAIRDIEIQDYQSNIQKQVDLSNSLKLNLSDDFSIDFNLSDSDKKELPELISTMPHWRNEDGSWNHKAVVDDAIKIKHFDQMLRAAYNQGVSSGQEKVIKGESNINLDQTTHSSANLNDKPDFEVEGLDSFLANKGTKLRFGKR